MIKNSPKTFDTSAPVLMGDNGPTAAGSSNTKEFLRCPKSWQYAYIRGLRVPQQQTPSHFARGTVFGAIRAAWFGLKFDDSPKAWRVLKRAAQKAAEDEALPVEEKDEAFALAMFGKYIEFWKRRPRPRPIATEFELGPCALSLDTPKALYRTGKLDDLSYYPEAGGALCLGECKTTSGDIGTLIKEYELHIQPLQYLALYNADPRGAKKYGEVAGIVLDVTCKPNERRKVPSFHRVFVEIRKETVQQFAESVAGYMNAMNKISWDSYVPRTYQCTYMAGRARVDCAFKPLCRFGRAAAGGYVMKGGSSLMKHKPTPGEMKHPWE